MNAFPSLPPIPAQRQGHLCLWPLPTQALTFSLTPPTFHSAKPPFLEGPESQVPSSRVYASLTFSV